MSKTQASRDALQIGMQTAVAFTKMQALGNDFVVLEAADLKASAPGREVFAAWEKVAGSLARRICDRRFGIGADGLILLSEARQPDCRFNWQYWNSDGSSSAMCGNGIRCAALYAVENNWCPPGTLRIETAAGPVEVKLESAELITSNLGAPLLQSQKIPLSGKARETVVKENLSVGAKQLSITCVSMGNPHCVLFDSRVPAEDRPVLAQQIQSLPVFPEGVNVEFADVLTPQQVDVQVWERGCGATLACASGAAAVLVAGVLEQRLDRDITVNLPGGTLRVWWSDFDDHVRISGPARTAFRGAFDLTQYCEGRQ